MVLNVADATELSYAQRIITATVFAISNPQYGFTMTAQLIKGNATVSDQYEITVNKPETDTVAFKIVGRIWYDTVILAKQYACWVDNFATERVYIPYHAQLNSDMATIYDWAVDDVANRHAAMVDEVVAAMEIYTI